MCDNHDRIGYEDWLGVTQQLYMLRLGYTCDLEDGYIDDLRIIID